LAITAANAALPNDQRRQLMLRKGRDYRPSNV
jgi:hypothetical protein